MDCVDASVFLSWLLPEDLSDRADAFFSRVLSDGSALIAPALVTAEVLSGLRRAVYRNRLSADDSNEARATFEQMKLGLYDLISLSETAWTLGAKTNAASLHDMFYLALAEQEDCQLWTADKRLVALLNNRFPRVHFLGEVELGHDKPA